MEVAFFTEMGFTGKVPRTHDNMRTEFAWMVALNADHYPIDLNFSKEYDLGIVIIPKKLSKFDFQKIKKLCKKVAVMQEGPHWYFQDYDLIDQIWYFNTLSEADIIFTHNKVDKLYYEGLVGHKDVRVLKSLMIEDPIGTLPEVQRRGVILGGNFVNWYGGFDSYVTAQAITAQMWAPSMGRKKEGEEYLVTHLPYMSWKNWIHKLNEFKIGIHMMRTHAAGTFALNCSYLGIPCIGYRGLDTQETLHPELSVDIADIGKAKDLARKLCSNKAFYKECSEITKTLYYEHYSEDKFTIGDI